VKKRRVSPQFLEKQGVSVLKQLNTHNNGLSHGGGKEQAILFQ
jgi:hypothetical protein